MGFCGIQNWEFKLVIPRYKGLGHSEVDTDFMHSSIAITALKYYVVSEELFGYMISPALRTAL